MRKNLFIMLTVLSGLVISLAACVLGEDIETLEINAIKANYPDRIVNIADVPDVAAPATGKVPVRYFTTEQYTGTVNWYPDHETFRYFYTYTATIKLTTIDKYTLKGVEANFFKVEGAMKTTSRRNSGEIYVEFPSTAISVIDKVDIEGVTAPSTGGYPVEYITSNEQYTGTVRWSPYVYGTFDKATPYTAIINLYPEDGYKLPRGVSDKFFKVAGAKSVSYSISYDDNFGVVEAVFPAIEIEGEEFKDLAANIWADVSLPSSSDGEWFRFTATEATQYIHVGFNTQTNLNIQVYDNDYNKIGDNSNLSSTSYIKYISQLVTSGQVYYIKVTPYSYSSSGTYRIAFNTSSTPPIPSNDATVNKLNVGLWADGSISSSSGEQWFKFTATATTQYIHSNFGTLSGMSVQVYDSSSNTVGQSNLSSTNKYIYQSVTNGQEYYIKVTPYNNSNGTYQIAFNTSSTPPSPTIMLIGGVWADGTLSSTGEQWFRFTATANMHYIHANFGTLNSSYGLYVQVYNSAGDTVENRTVLNISTTSTSRSVTSEQEYYIKVTPYSSSGTYQIAFNTTYTPPSPTITLIGGVWADGDIDVSGGEQWFKFTATASTHYIHVSFGTLDALYVQVYNSVGATVGSQTNLINDTKYVSRSVTSGQVYYIRVTPYNSSGTYQIAFNTSSTPPSPTITLTDTWADGNILTSNDVQWFKFTATADTQYIHVKFGTLSSLFVQIYNSTGIMVGTPEYLYSSSYISKSVIRDQVYYIKVTPSGSGGTYLISFTKTTDSPSIGDGSEDYPYLLIENKWSIDNIPSSTNDTDVWYSFNVTDGTTYNVWWNYESEGNSLRTLDIEVTAAYSNNGDSIFEKRDAAWGTAISFTATQNGTVKLKVSPKTAVDTGTFAIVYSTGTVRP